MQARMKCSLHHLRPSGTHPGTQGYRQEPLLRSISVDAAFHESDRVESCEAGRKSTMHIRRVGQLCLGPTINITASPSALQHVGYVCAHVQAVAV